jgi:hypothetical protein
MKNRKMTKRITLIAVSQDTRILHNDAIFNQKWHGAASGFTMLGL